MNPPGRPAAPPPAERAKAALRRLAQERQEPTPEAYARAWALEGGGPSPSLPAPGPDGPAWAALIERALRGVERGNRSWTTARRKDSLARMLEAQRGDAQRLHERLDRLVASWDERGAAGEGEASPEPVLAPRPAELPGAPPEDPHPAAQAAPKAELPADRPAAPPADLPAGPCMDLRRAPPDAGAAGRPAALRAGPGAAPPAVPQPPAAARPAPPATSVPPDAGAATWPPAAAALAEALQQALPPEDPLAAPLRAALAAWPPAQPPQGPDAGAQAALDALCAEAGRLIGHRQHGSQVLGQLCAELGESLVELAEDGSWAEGQAQLLRQQIAQGLSARGVRQAGTLLAEARRSQQRLRAERQATREALQDSIRRMLDELAGLARESDRYGERLDVHAQAIAQADSLSSLAGRVQALVADSRAVHGVIEQAQDRLHGEQARAEALQARVRGLEDELRRLSSELTTDPLTALANRRGLQQAFAAAAQAGPGAPPLAVGLLDVDDFKRLNDRLGHARGDQALQFLARQVGAALRPADTLARYGGEEFVLLLPGLGLDEAVERLGRLQRRLSAELFATDGEARLFVTFSAGVTLHRPGEPLEAALERADVGLYTAKRSGKNRSCAA